ncbi:MAG: methyltransferase domain-containing protein [Actinomycetota bacterium]|nr:methyltransferase domain-containing protein [Actinomycetota bacterium]
MNQLLTAEALRLLDEVGEIDSKADVLAIITKLRKAGHPALLVTEVITQARLRTRAKAKFGDFAASMLFTEAGLEQATRLQVAALHAERLKLGGFKKIADLGCGIGADSLAFASLGLEVTAVEQDPQTAALASFNLAPFPNAEVQVSDAEQFDLTNFDAVWLDPARRDLERKGAKHITLTPADFSPNLDWSFGIAKPKGIKLGPAFPLELIPADVEAQWVSHQGDLVELVLWFDRLREKPGRTALMLKDGQRYIFEGLGLERSVVDSLKQYIYEPDSSLIRSQLLGEFASQQGMTGVSEGIAYLSSESLISSPWLKTYEVLETLPLDELTIRKALAQRGIGKLEIKKRGVDITPEELRPKLKLKGEGAATLILTKVGDARRALIVQPIR